MLSANGNTPPLERRRPPTLRPPGPAPRSWPEAAVAIVRIVSGNAVIAFLAWKGILSPDAILAALGIGAIPGVVGLVRGALRGAPRP